MALTAQAIILQQSACVQVKTHGDAGQSSQTAAAAISAFGPVNRVNDAAAAKSTIAAAARVKPSAAVSGATQPAAGRVSSTTTQSAATTSAGSLAWAALVKGLLELRQRACSPEPTRGRSNDQRRNAGADQDPFTGGPLPAAVSAVML